MFWSSSLVLNVVGTDLILFDIFPFLQFPLDYLRQILVFMNITDVGVTQAYCSILVAEQGGFLGTGDSLFDSIKSAGSVTHFFI